MTVRTCEPEQPNSGHFDVVVCGATVSGVLDAAVELAKQRERRG